jgi:hypothetical protein
MKSKYTPWPLLGMTWLAAVITALMLSALMPDSADARERGPTIEGSVGGGYTRSNFGNGNYNWNRRLGASLAYNFSEQSGLELSFQDVLDRTMVKGFEETTFHDVIYGLNWIQSLSDRSWRVQPYFKGGVGVLNRDATAYYSQMQVTTISRLDQITGILGAGLRIYITQSFAIRIEATSYLTGGMLATWKDNIALTSGLSLVF